MQTVTRFKAKDGAVFDTVAACEAHEALIAAIDAAFEGTPIQPKDDGCAFANGGGYLQWTQETYDRVLAALMALVPEDMQRCEPLSYGFMCTLDDIGHRLYGPFCRMLCIDGRLREYGQMYFKLNPHEAKDVCLNPQG